MRSLLCSPLTPAAILPVEKSLPNILALCHCYSFLPNTLQSMLRRNSKVIGTLELLPTLISLLNCSNISIYQKSSYKNQPNIYLFIHSSLTWHYLYSNPWDKNVILLVSPEVKLWQQIIWCPCQSYFKEIVYHSPWHQLRLPVTAKQSTGLISS